jgi:NitT/TauT family transport system substrate-binding protein
VDVVCGFYEHTIRTQAQGKELVLFTLFDLYPGMVLMVGTRHAGDVRTIRDLVGHPVGVTAPGSSTDAMVKYLLKQNGLDPQSIAVVAAGTTTMLAALEQDRVWAGVSVDPLASKIERDGTGRPLYDTRTEAGTRSVFGGAWPAGGLYAPRDFVERNPRTVQALADAGVRTLRFIHSHDPEEVARRMPEDFWAGNFALYAAALARNRTMFSTDGTMPEEGPPSVLRTLELVDPKVLATRIELGRTYDNTFVRRVPGDPKR